MDCLDLMVVTAYDEQGWLDCLGCLRYLGLMATTTPVVLHVRGSLVSKGLDYLGSTVGIVTAQPEIQEYFGSMDCWDLMVVTAKAE